MSQLLKHIETGQVYRRSDLEFYSSSIDRDLIELTKNGFLLKVNQGLYYAPKKSKFGIVPPNEHILIERFLKDDNFLIVSPNSYNTLGLGLTQLYNQAWVYNHKRKGIIKLNGKTFDFKLKSSFPKEITKEFLLIDLLNNIYLIAEDQESIIDKLSTKLSDFNQDTLKVIIQRYGSGSTKKVIKNLIR